MRTRKLKPIDYSEPFEPMDSHDLTPANKRVVSDDLQDMVYQAHLLSSQISQHMRRRKVLREKIATKIAEMKVKPNEDGHIVHRVGGKTVIITPNERYSIKEEEARQLFKERNLLNQVARVHLIYSVPPSVARSIARRIWEMIQSKLIEVRTEWHFDEEKIDQFYHAGKLSDEDIDLITSREPVGSGYRLRIDDLEDSDDEEQPDDETC